MKLTKKIFTAEKEELTCDISRTVETVLSWMVHLIRGLKKNETKQHLMSTLDEITGLWLSNWAQKIFQYHSERIKMNILEKKGTSLEICFVYKK